MRFKKGSRIEVFSNKQGPYGGWRCAEIISGNGHTYNIRYFSFNEKTTIDRVPRKIIRPIPPPVDVERWEAGELVEALDDFAWKAATIRQESCGKYYLVRLLGSASDLTFHKGNIRVRQSWQDERWVEIGKVVSTKSSTLTGSDVQETTSVVVPGRTLKRKSAYEWYDCAESCIGTTKKIRTVEKVGCCQMVRVRLNESIRGNECYDSDVCSVGSCSGDDGSSQQEEDSSCSSDAESSSCEFGEEEEGRQEGDGERRMLCRSELFTYRNTLGELFACGPLSWEQETSLTDLRLSLNISDDEHLVEEQCLA